MVDQRCPKTFEIDCKDKEKNQYWYNPVYFVSGNRLKMYEENTMRVTIEHKHA